MRCVAFGLALLALWGCGIKGEPLPPDPAVPLPPLPSGSLTGYQ